MRYSVQRNKEIERQEVIERRKKKIERERRRMGGEGGNI